MIDQSLFTSVFNRIKSFKILSILFLPLIISLTSTKALADECTQVIQSGPAYEFCNRPEIGITCDLEVTTSYICANVNGQEDFCGYITTYLLYYIAIDGTFSERSLIGACSTSASGPSAQSSLIPISSSYGSCKQAYSFVSIDNLSLQESIPLVGVPFSINYSSERFRTGFSYSPKLIGLGGWAPDILHHYDVNNKILYFGNGTLRPIEVISQDNKFYLTNESGSEVYYFDANGRHLQTKDAIMGVIKFNFDYDLSGKLSKIKDQFNNETSFSYSIGQVLMTSPYGQISTLSLDSIGFLSSVRSPNNEIYSSTYNSNGFLISFTKPMGQTSHVTYDSNGYVAKDIGAAGDFLSLSRIFDQVLGIQTVTTSTAKGIKTVYSTSATLAGSNHTIKDPAGDVYNSIIQNQQAGTTSNNNGKATQSTLAQDPRFGWLVPYESNSSFVIADSNINISLQTTKSADILNPADPFSFLNLTSVTTLQNDPTRKYTSRYNSQTKLLTLASPANRIIEKRFNQNGKVASFRQGSLAPIEFNYDSRGNVSLIQQNNRNITLAYDTRGNVANSTDPLGRVTQFVYDQSNRMIEQKAADGSQTLFAYDKNGNLTSLTPPGRAAHQFTYNLMELVSSYLPPSINAQILGVTQYTYDLDQNIIQINRPNSSVLGFSYNDTSGLLNSISSPEGNFVLSYKPNSKLISQLSSPQGVILNYQYSGDILRSVSTSGPFVGAINYNYNSDGTIASLSTSDALASLGSIGFQYDKDALIIGVGSESITRNDTGNISSIRLKNILQNLTYDMFDQINSDKILSNQNVLSNKNYTRDQAGRVIEIKSLEQGSVKVSTKSYAYDSVGRLTKVFDNNQLVREYKYDLNGNRVEVIGVRASIFATYDEQDRLLQYGNKKYRYNANGELIEKLETSGRRNKTTYLYDSVGSLKSVALPNRNVISYIMDGQNRRIAKKVNGRLVQGFIYQSQTQVAAELDASGKIIKQFIYGSKINIPDYMIFQGKEYRIISDHVGTPVSVVEALSGRVIEKYEFDEFGISQNKVGNGLLPFGFAGGIYDSDTGLLKFGARDYDPETGRWTSKDPILFAGGDTNLMGYVSNDPVNFIDPSGLKLQFGSGQARQQLSSSMAQIWSTQAGRSLINQLNGSNQVYSINVNSSGEHYQQGNMVTVDPNDFPGVNASPLGIIPASTTRILSHELGHLTGTGDNGNLNVNMWENPIMTALGGFSRTSYGTSGVRCGR